MPGMAILQMVFHKGLFSGNIHDVSELLLLVVWSFMFSGPYYLAATIYMMWLNPYQDITTGADVIESSADAYEESVGLTLLLLLITLGSYKLMLWGNWPPGATYLGVKQEYVFCVAAIGITMLVSFPLASLYYWGLNKIATRIVLRKTRSRPLGQ